MKIFLVGYVRFGKAIFSQTVFVFKSFKFTIFPLHITLYAYNISIYFTQKGSFHFIIFTYLPFHYV